MKWEEVTLGDISTNIQTGPFGSQLHQSDYSMDGVPVVMPKDLIGGKVIEDSIAKVEEYHINRLSRHKLKEGNIIYARRGDVGKCSYITQIEEGWLCGTGCLKVELDEKKVVPKFVFYQLQKSETIGWIEKHAIGATMLNLNTSILSSVPISVPTLEIQQRIASILSAYDDLIENNQKQIKLLEEAAQRLYKEWFVNLHFPGHEDVEIIDGLPVGWDVVSIKEIAEFKRGKTITKDTIIDGNIPVIAGGVQPAYYHNVANTVAPVITVSASGANAGYTALHNINVWASDCSFVDGNSKNIYYLFCFLKNSPETMQNLQRGSAQPHVYAKAINEIKILRPSKKVLERFDSFVNAYFSAIAVNERNIKELTEARDRLLPKLMSGEVEV